MDFIGSIDGKYLLVTVDFLSSRVQVDVHQNANKGSVMSSPQRWVRVCGLISQLVTDRSRQFTRGAVQQWCERGGVERIYSRAYDHRSNGLIERCNRIVLETLRKLKLADRTDKWLRLVTQVERVIKGSFHRASGRTPFEAFMALCKFTDNW